MATNYLKLPGGSVKITSASGRSTYARLSNPLVSYNDVSIIVEAGKFYKEISYADLGTINGSAKPGDIASAAELLADSVFNYGGGSGSGATSDVTKAYVDAKIADLQSKIDTNTTAIGNNTTAIGTNTTAISNNTTAINQNAADIILRKRKTDFIEVVTTIDFPSIAAQTMGAGITVSNTSTSGIAGSDPLILGKSSNRNVGLQIDVIAGTNLVTFLAYNYTAAAIDNVNGTYKVTAVKASGTT